MRTTLHPHASSSGHVAAAFALSLVLTGSLAASAAAQGSWGRGYPGDGRAAGGYGAYGAYDEARPLFAWSGRVDREAYIIMQGGDVRTRIDGYGNGAGGDARVRAALPQADGMVDVRIAEGRGRVDVIEQPSRRNGYRAVVRVRDDDAGAGFYRFVATWRPTGGYGYNDGRYGNGTYGSGGPGDGRYGDGRYGDGRYGDGRYGDGRYGDGRYDGAPGAPGGVYGGGYGGSGVLQWHGRVDDVAEIRLHGDRIDTRTVSGQGVSGIRTRLAGGALPERDVEVHVAERAGRGRVSVVQQPHAWNGYTAVVRVEDRDPGADWYDLDVTW